MMKKTTDKVAFEFAEKRMNELLAMVTNKGGFEKLAPSEQIELNTITQLVKSYEESHYTIPLPQTLQGLISLKMYENNWKQKDLAKKLKTTETKLSEIMNNKRKPSVSFIKAIHVILGIDGNLLLKVV
jgi:HTH-type transcriptional regulator/antitoxin HigA